MALRNGIDRNMGMLFPQYIDDYIPKNHIVRVYDKIIDIQSDDKLGLEYDKEQVGNPRYNPRIMLKILVYSYSQKIRTSRKIEKALYENISFKWLSQDLKPDHKTISEFRRNNKKAIKNTLKLVIKTCKELDLIEGNYLFMDGTKIKGNASIENTWTKKQIKRVMNNLDRHIEKLIHIHEQNDKLEEGHPSYVRIENIEEKLNKIIEKKKELEEINKKIEERNGDKNYNTTDDETTILKTRHGSIAGYNGQVVVDGKCGIIIQSDLLSKNNDFNLFREQFKKAIENTGIDYIGGVADAGYSSARDLKELVEEGKDIIVPSERTIVKERKSRDFENTTDLFSKENFKYYKERDYFICPMGHKLVYKKNEKINSREKVKRYFIEDKNICIQCPYFGQCTKSKSGRSVRKAEYENIRNKLAKRYSSKEGRKIYSQRKYKIETVFGHMKHNLGFREFLLRGVDGALAELQLFSINYNIMKMIKIKGVNKLLEVLK